MSINRRALKSNVVLTVKDITFPPSSGTDWAADDEVVFTGTLEEVLVFGIKHFSVFTTLIQEDYRIVWNRNWQDMEAYPITPVVLLGATHVLPAEVTLVDLVTNGYRRDFGDGAGLVLEQIADPTVRMFFQGSRSAILSYLLQLEDQGAQRIYELYNFSLFDSAKASGLGTAFDDILGSLGPVELEKAHVTLVSAIAGANILR
jgi:hypothetical protein